MHALAEFLVSMLFGAFPVSINHYVVYFFSLQLEITVHNCFIRRRSKSTLKQQYN